MQTDDKIKLDQYFSNRNVSPEYYSEYKIQRFLEHILPSDKSTAILDVGCGFGQFLFELKKRGYTNIQGIDISNESIEACKAKGLTVTQIQDIIDFAPMNQKKFDFIIMSHVLEHIAKEKIIDTLKAIKTMLSDNGKFFVMVPNGQSNTGAYWMYEDFTHSTLFTAGSLLYVLKSAGFTHVEFVDPSGFTHVAGYKKWVLSLFLNLYELKNSFWNKITGSSYHKPSPRIYTFEVKALAQ